MGETAASYFIWSNVQKGQPPNDFLQKVLLIQAGSWLHPNRLQAHREKLLRLRNWGRGMCWTIPQLIGSIHDSLTEPDGWRKTLSSPYPDPDSWVSLLNIDETVWEMEATVPASFFWCPCFIDQDVCLHWPVRVMPCYDAIHCMGVWVWLARTLDPSTAHRSPIVLDSPWTGRIEGMRAAFPSRKFKCLYSRFNGLLYSYCTLFRSLHIGIR